MERTINIRGSRKKSLFILLAGFLLLGVSFLFFAYVGDEVFGWLFMIASAFILILGLTGLRDRKPRIIITSRGITEPYSIKEEIEWEAIVRADDFYFRGQDFVRLLLPDNYKPGLIVPTWFWRLSRVYAKQGLKAVYIRVSGLEINSGELTDLIEKMAAAGMEQRDGYLWALAGKLNHR